MEGGADMEMFGHRQATVCQLGSQSPGVSELLRPFQRRPPGQYCGLLCVSVRSRALGSRCLSVGTEVEGQRDN